MGIIKSNAFALLYIRYWTINQFNVIIIIDWKVSFGKLTPLNTKVIP